MGEGLAQVFQGMIGNAFEASALALLVALMVRAGRCEPALRHLLWLLVLLKLLLPPVLVDPWGMGPSLGRAEAWLRSWSPPAPAVGGEAGWDPAPQLWPEPAPEVFSPPVSEGAAALAVFSPPVPPEGAGAPFLAEEEQPESGPAGRDWTALLASGGSALWLLGALVTAAVQAVRIASFRARLRSAAPSPPDLGAACRALAGRLGLVRPPALRILPGLSSPMVWALGRPLIILPPELASPAGRAVLPSVLAHELAHLRRRDPWVSWLELLALCLYWWLPTLWWARRELRRSADQACDAWAVTVVGSRRSYATSLLASIEILKEAGTPLPAGGLGLGEREALERRLTMVMRERLSPRLSWRACLVAALTGILALPASPLRLGAQVAKLPGEGVQEAGTGDSVAPVSPAKAAEPVAPATPPVTPAEPAPAADPTPAGKGAPGPAKARASRSPADTESRLESLERKMARILDELEALRAGPGVREITPADAPVPVAPAAPRKRTVRAASSRNGAGVATIEAGPGPRTGVVVAPPPGEPGWPTQQVYDHRQALPGAGNREYVYERSYRAATGKNAFKVDPRRLPVSDEKRKQVEDINRNFEKRLKALLDEQKRAMDALMEEHRSTIRESLKNELSEEEIEEVELNRPQSVPTPAKK